MRKRALSLALALMLCLCLSAPVFAANGDFVIENGVLTKYDGPGGNVTIPDGVTAIGDKAFYGCGSLTGVTIPDTVTTIGYWAFDACTNLTSVIIPSSVTSIGEGAFRNCQSLTEIQVAANNQVYSSVDGVAFSKDMKTLITYPGGKQGAYSIPTSVTSIGDAAFYDCGRLTSVTIPSSVTSIGNNAFFGCTGLASVTIFNGVVAIGLGAFAACTSLTSVTIPTSVTGIGFGAFTYCTSLTSVTIPNSVTSIGDRAFRGCIGLTSVTIPDSVNSIGDYAFDRCFSLTDVYYGGTEAQWNAVTIGEANDALLGADIHYNSAAPDTPSQSKTASPTNDRLTVNGVLQNPTVYKIGGSNFFKIRDLAAMLSGTEKQFDVGYDAALKSVTLTTGKSYASPDNYLIGALGGSQTAIPSNDAVYIDGQKIDVTVYKIGGSNFFMLRDLGKALDFYVGWTRETGVFIDTSKPYSE